MAVSRCSYTKSALVEHVLELAAGDLNHAVPAHPEWT